MPSPKGHPPRIPIESQSLSARKHSGGDSRIGGGGPINGGLATKPFDDTAPQRLALCAQVRAARIACRVLSHRKMDHGEPGLRVHVDRLSMDAEQHEAPRLSWQKPDLEAVTVVAAAVIRHLPRAKRVGL